MNNALITAVIAISIVGVFGGVILATNVIRDECKSYQATVIYGQKFRCEQVKE